MLICQKRELKNTDPSPRNTKIFSDAQNILSSMYQIEQDYVTQKSKKAKLQSMQSCNQCKVAINIKKSALARKIANEISGRKKYNKAKLKAEKERIKQWHDQFKELLGKPTSNSISPNIYERSV